MTRPGIDVERMSRQFLTKYWPTRRAEDTAWDVNVTTAMVSAYTRTVLRAAARIAEDRSRWKWGPGARRLKTYRRGVVHGRAEAALDIRQAARTRKEK